MSFVPRLSVISMIVAASLPPPLWAAQFVVEDHHGRNLATHGVTLVDWEGPIADPAIRLVVRPPANASFPLSATLSANHRRLYFDASGTVGASGPSLGLSFANAGSSQTVYMSVFGDADGVDENYTLTLSGGPNPPTTIPIHVVDQDLGTSPPFHVWLDFGQDQTGFFGDASHRAAIQQAADDWAYFIAGMALDPVPAGSEYTFIWDPDGFNTGHWELNASDYTGYLLYAYGIHSAELRSGGEPSSGGGFQSSGGNALTIRRSGGTEIETDGNFNSLGWFVSTDPNDWYVSGNFGDELNDLFSIAHHEIGHALFFNPANTTFGDYKTAGHIDAPAVVAYHGSPVPIDSHDHFDGAEDRLSRKGAFGWEFYGTMPARRWQITKLDLLCAQAIGYTLRPTSALAGLQITDASLVAGVVGSAYTDGLQAAGGIPASYWTVDSGVLPPGLGLDSFSGAVSGVPTTTGTFNCVVRVRDADEAQPGVTAAVQIIVNNASGVGPVDGPAWTRLTASPNPVVGRTQLSFYLARPGETDLDIFDLQGKRVRRITTGPNAAGWHSFPVETAGFGAGVYFVRLRTDDGAWLTRITVER